MARSAEQAFSSSYFHFRTLLSHIHSFPSNPELQTASVVVNHNLKYIIFLKNCLLTYFIELLAAAFLLHLKKYELQRALTLSEKQPSLV